MRRKGKAVASDVVVRIMRMKRRAVAVVVAVVVLLLPQFQMQHQMQFLKWHSSHRHNVIRFLNRSHHQ